MPALINVNGETVTEASLHVPNVGPWWADVVFELAPVLFGSVTLDIGDLSLTGTILERETGTFAGQLKARIVAGGAGWGSLIATQHYHSDGVSGEGGGVRAQTIAEDAARLAGESIGTFTVINDVVGIDYVRQAGLASRVLEDVIGGAPWHVDYSGDTNVGERSTDEAETSDYQVLDYAPSSRIVTLAIDDLSAVGVGSIISEGLDTPETIYELQIRATVDRIRALAWVGGSALGRGRLSQLLVDIANRSVDGRLHGKFRYRVVSMSGDRVELQAVSGLVGLPDVLPVSMNPGTAGTHSELAGGSIVLVEFIEGDRTLPIITAFAGKDGTGHETTEIVFSVSSKIKLGSDSASDAVALAPSVDSQFNDINGALDAFVSTLPVTNDGGLALQAAVKLVWGSGAPPKPPSSVGATKVDAE